jgi:hypothetical protein
MSLVDDRGTTAWRGVEETDLERAAADKVYRTLDASARFSIGKRRHYVGSVGLQTLRPSTQRVDISRALTELAQSITTVLVVDDASRLPDADPRSFDPTRLADIRSFGITEVGGDLASWYSSMLDEE